MMTMPSTKAAAKSANMRTIIAAAVTDRSDPVPDAEHRDRTSNYSASAPVFPLWHFERHTDQRTGLRVPRARVRACLGPCAAGGLTVLHPAM
jgi:hypothetical protein